MVYRLASAIATGNLPFGEISCGCHGDVAGELKPMQDGLLACRLPDHSRAEVPLMVRLETPAEVDDYLAGGILPYVLNQILT